MIGGLGFAMEGAEAICLCLYGTHVPHTRAELFVLI
jgi:hypothetical protein